ncbi:RNA polymerase sigma factor [Aestuariibacter sp. AA17]|uniref:RNA polymerase sigma factor n=1 Tax=Fluctibacter corallii TaxID=2984329 RepID=A0ABT3A9J2_9ALTE|nr:RNA polymerase sigma factor [Aestuariibacter sp. AA17]MCV2885348.1 RNA polymerase sigma factor [Aestuariibacter sp. AA17]
MNNKSSVSKTFLSYRKQIIKAISGIVKRDDIEDIVQETFVKTYEAELKQEITYERTYMLKTARNLALNHVSRASETLSEEFSEDITSPKELIQNNIEKQVESKERFLHFCKATDTLSSEVKRVFILKKVYGLSQREIANQLSLSESTVEKHVAKGLHLCAVYLQNLNKNDSDNVINSRAINKLATSIWRSK